MDTIAGVVSEEAFYNEHDEIVGYYSHGSFDPRYQYMWYDMNLSYYRLNENREAVPCEVAKWEECLANVKSRIVGFDAITPTCHISTVFLTLDHNFVPGRPPLLFETAIFGGRFDQRYFRYTTWEQAEEGHARVVRALAGSVVKYPKRFSRAKRKKLRYKQKQKERQLFSFFGVIG